MSYFKNIVLAGAITGVTLCVGAGCSSSEEYVEPVRNTAGDQVSGLGEVLINPELYLNQELALEGVVQSIKIKKVNKDITLLVMKLTPLESKHLLLKPDPDMAKFRFIEKLRQAEDIYTGARYKNLKIRHHMQKKMKSLACDMNVASEKIEALSHYYSGIGQVNVAATLKTMGKGYKKIGDAYFSFEKVASMSSMGDEVLPTDQLENVEKFEKALDTGGVHLLDFVTGMAAARDAISNGMYSYPKQVLNHQRSYEILTFGSSVSAESWEKKKSEDQKGFEVSSVLAEGVKALGEGDKLVNNGLLSLADILSKTAIKAQREKAPALRCAYYGFNGTHLSRCAQALSAVGHAPIKIKGSLIQSNLREEVDVLWLQAEVLEIDGMIFKLSYGEENGTLKDAMNLYNWAEDVKKGGK
jgi:hypothetical protein